MAENPSRKKVMGELLCIWWLYRCLLFAFGNDVLNYLYGYLGLEDNLLPDDGGSQSDDTSRQKILDKKEEERAYYATCYMYYNEL